MLLSVAVCGGAHAEESIEVISQPDEVVLDLSHTDKEYSNEQEEKAEKPTGQDKPEQKDATKEVVEKDREADAVEVKPAEVVGSPIGGTKAAISLTPYGNASPTNQYAVYAAGLIKEVPLNGHYAFLQDTATSYVFVAGTGDSLAALSGASWWRWYNAGNLRGWVLERGSGSVSVRDSEYTVLSDLEGYPALQDSGIEQLRREVMLYASVVVVAHVLGRVWSYQLRAGKRSLG